MIDKKVSSDTRSVMQVSRFQEKGINWHITKDGRRVISDSNGMFELAEEDAIPLYISGWREVSSMA